MNRDRPLSGRTAAARHAARRMPDFMRRSIDHQPEMCAARRRDGASAQPNERRSAESCARAISRRSPCSAPAAARLAGRRRAPIMVTARPAPPGFSPPHRPHRPLRREPARTAASPRPHPRG
ncbi:hypothetical protein WS86_11980 [Burkholderia savannae]|nr:hypothetical protein WS86_11980 [Burkholderia savannae]